MFNEVCGSSKVDNSPTGKPGGRRAFPAAAARKPPLLLNDIRDRAFARWVDAGMPSGDGSRFWLEAEQEVRGDR